MFGDSNHIIVKELVGGAYLHHFTNAAGVEYSSISFSTGPEKGAEIRSVERSYENGMVETYERNYNNDPEWADALAAPLKVIAGRKVENFNVPVQKFERHESFSRRTKTKHTKTLDDGLYCTLSVNTSGNNKDGTPRKRLSLTFSQAEEMMSMFPDLKIRIDVDGSTMAFVPDDYGYSLVKSSKNKLTTGVTIYDEQVEAYESVAGEYKVFKDEEGYYIKLF